MIERFNICGYTRISVDLHEDRDNTSIENQKAIIEDYVQRNFPECGLDVYVDRDRSGYTFSQREQYQIMRKKLVAGEYDILIVKDLSRFSRRNGVEVRLAVFADYGLVTFGTSISADKPAIQTPAVFSDKEDMFTPIQVNHVLSTTLAGNGKITPLTAGVRLIVTVPYESKPAYPCRCVRGN